MQGTGTCCLKIPSQSLGEGLRVPRRKFPELERTEEGSLVMNASNLKIICEMEGLYEFPEMNSKIYLHYKVIDQIAALEPYTHLKALYLENNVIRKIQGLDSLGELMNLFLQNNMIKKIEGLSGLKNLRVLNLANNNIFKVQGLQELVQLQNLTLAKNYLSDFNSLEQLGQCSTTLSAIDISDNQITPDDRLFDLIKQIKILYLYGNQLVREMMHYRRTVVGKLPELMYLDQRGIDKEERIMAEAWVNEGEIGFRKARQQIIAFRKEKRAERSQEIMKNIDVHRKNKINVFTKNILQAEEEICKLKNYLSEPGNQSQHFFYQSSITEATHKIRDNQSFIDSLYKRLGMQPEPPVYSIDLGPELQQEIEENVRESGGGLYQVQEANEQQQLQSESSEPSEVSKEGRKSQTSQPSQSNSSQQQSLKTYNSLDELD